MPHKTGVVHGLEWPAQWPLSFVNPEKIPTAANTASVGWGTTQPTFSFILPGPERFPADQAPVTTGTTRPRITTFAPRRFNGRRRNIEVTTLRPTLSALTPVHTAPSLARLAPGTTVTGITPHIPVAPVQPEPEIETLEAPLTFDPAVDSFELCPDAPPRVVGSGALVLFAFSTATAVDGTLIHPRLVENGGVAYLKQLAFVINDVRLRTNSDDSLDLGGTAGPHLTNEWEESDVAITMQHGEHSVTIGGPRSSDARFADHFEPYDWQLLPEARARLVAWLNDIEWTTDDCEIRITLDDGIRPPVEFNALRYDTELDTTEPTIGTVGPFSPSAETGPVSLQTVTPTLGLINPTEFASNQSPVETETESPTLRHINPSITRPEHQAVGTGTLVPTLTSIPPALIEGRAVNFEMGTTQSNFTLINPVPISPNQAGVGVATESDVDPIGPTDVGAAEADIEIEGEETELLTLQPGGIAVTRPNPFPVTTLSQVSTLGPINTRFRLNQNRIQIPVIEPAFTVFQPRNLNPPQVDIGLGTAAPTFGALQPGFIDITKPPASFGTLRPQFTRINPAIINPRNRRNRIRVATTEPTLSVIQSVTFNANTAGAGLDTTSPTFNFLLGTIIAPNLGGIEVEQAREPGIRGFRRIINPRHRRNRIRVATTEPTLATIQPGTIQANTARLNVGTLNTAVGILAARQLSPPAAGIAIAVLEPTLTHILPSQLVPAHPGIRVGTVLARIAVLAPGEIDPADPRIRIPTLEPTLTSIAPAQLSVTNPDVAFPALTPVVATLGPTETRPTTVAVQVPTTRPVIDSLPAAVPTPANARFGIGTLRPAFTIIQPVNTAPANPPVQIPSLPPTIGTISPVHTPPANPSIGIGSINPNFSFIAATILAPNLSPLEIDPAREPSLSALRKNINPRPNRNRIRVATLEAVITPLDPGDLNAEPAEFRVGTLQPPLRPLQPSLLQPPQPNIEVGTEDPEFTRVGPFNTAPPNAAAAVGTVQPVFNVINPQVTMPRPSLFRMPTTEPTFTIIRPAATRPTPAALRIGTLQPRLSLINPSQLTPEMPEASFDATTPNLGRLDGTRTRPNLAQTAIPALEAEFTVIQPEQVAPVQGPVQMVSVVPELAPLGPVASEPVQAPVQIDSEDVLVALNGPFNVGVSALPEPYAEATMPTIGLLGPIPTTPANNPTGIDTLSPTFKLRTTEVASCSFDISITSKGSNFVIFGVSVRPLTGYLICGDIVEGGGDAYLKRLEFFAADRIAVLQTHATDDASENGAEPGPHLTDKWEKSDTAIVLTFGNKTWTLSGPNTGTGPDSTEPYQWRFSEQQATDLTTFLNGISGDDTITVLFDDGPDPVPPVQPAVEMPTLEPVIDHIPTQVTRPRTARNRVNIGTTEPTIQVSIPVGITLRPGMELTAPEVQSQSVGPSIISPQRPNASFPTTTPPIEPMIFIHFNAERADVAPVGRRTIFTTREPEPIVARQAAFRIPTTVATLHHIIPTFAIAPPPRPLHQYLSITAWLRSFPGHELLSSLPGWIDLTWDTRWQQAGRAKLIFEERAIDRDLLNTLIGGSHAVELVIHTDPIRRLYGVINMVTLSRSVADEKFNTNPVTHLTVADNYRASSNTQARVLVAGPAPLTNYRRRDAIEFDPDLDTAAKKRRWGEQELKRTADLHTTNIKSTLRTLQEPAKVVLELTDIFGALRDRWVIPNGDATLFEDETAAGEYIETLLNSYIATPFNMSVTKTDDGNGITEPLRYKNLLNAVAQAARYGDVGVEVQFDHTNESLDATIHSGRDRRTGAAFTTLGDRLDRQTLKVGDIANRPIWNDPEDTEPMLIQTLQTIGIRLMAGIAKPTQIDPEYRVLNT